MVVQGAQLLPRRVGGRIAALRRIGKFRRGPENVAMRIARARRRDVLGFNRLRIRAGDRLGHACYCFSIFARSITAFHLAISEISSSCRASGVLPRASTPSSPRRLRTSGALTAALTSRLTRSITVFGVFAGAATAFHDEAW